MPTDAEHKALPPHLSTHERLFDTQAATDLLVSLLDVQGDADPQVVLQFCWPPSPLLHMHGLLG